MSRKNRPRSTAPRARTLYNTHVDELLSVSDEQVAEDAGFVEVSEADHVLHSVDGGGMHGFDVSGILRGDPMLLQETGGEHHN